MRRKGKVLLAVLVAVVLVIGIALWQLLANLDTLVARVIEEQGSEATGTSVTVDAVSIDLPAGSGTISGLEVANPPEFSRRPAIAFEEIAVSLDPLAAAASPIVIREVIVSGATLLMEQTTDGNNLVTIRNALAEPSAGEAEAEGPGIVIERFVLEGASLVVDVPQLDESREASIGRVELADIGRAANGATAGAVARQILEPVLRAALESAAAGDVGTELRRKFDEELDERKSELTEKLREKLPSRDDEPRDQP